MKKVLLLAALFLPMIASAQQFDFKLSDVPAAGIDNTKDPFDRGKHKIDMNDDGWKNIAIVVIKAVPDQAAADQIKIKYGTKTVDGIYTTATKELKFDLTGDDEFKISKGIFNLVVNGASKGKLQFETTAKTGGTTTTEVSPTDGKLSTYIGLLANANFVGNNKFLSNLTPIVTLGGITTIYSNEKNFKWDLDINPYLGAQIDVKDTVSFIPALMLPGRAGLILNNYFHFGSGDKFQFTLMPFGFGLKLIPGMKDSSTIIIQHNLRFGAAIRYADIFIIGCQYTHGFHNTTSESQSYYKTVFGNTATDINYLTITGQFHLPSNNESTGNYLFIEWRGLLNKKHYEPFTNNTILTFGVRKDFSLSTIFATSTGKAKNSIKMRTPF